MNISVLANYLQSAMGPKIIVSIVLGGIILFNYKKFLLWIPFLPFSGIWIYSKDAPPEIMFVNSYIELIVVFTLLCKSLHDGLDKTSIAFIGLSALALPSLIQSGGHLFLSLFILICLFAGAGVYKLYLTEMKQYLQKRYLDYAVLIWVVLGSLVKVYSFGREGGDILAQRGGGILGSNHVGGILLLLMPIVRGISQKKQPIFFDPIRK